MAVAPDTLIVAWHWPPAQRASTTVLANLFRAVSPGSFRVVTRQGPGPRPAEGPPPPPLETQAVSTVCAGDRNGAITVWLASLVAAVQMVQTAWRRHRARPFECVLAVYPHRFGLLTGWWIARRCGVPFAAYMHDLFAEAYQTRWWLKRWFWRWVDQRALRDAALVVVPTEEFAAHYRGRGVAHTLVLPHCVPADVPASPPPPCRPLLNLVYSGLLYEAHREAMQAFLQACAPLDDVGMTLLTLPHPLLNGRPACWVSRSEALEAIRQADVGVVVLGHQTPYAAEIKGCFPSKIIDYLVVGRPILAVVPPGCFVDRFIRTTGVGVVVNTLVPEDIRTALHGLRDPHLRGRLAQAARRTARQLQAEEHLPRLLQSLAGIVRRGWHGSAEGERGATGVSRAGGTVHTLRRLAPVGEV